MFTQKNIVSQLDPEVDFQATLVHDDGIHGVLQGTIMYSLLVPLRIEKVGNSRTLSAYRVILAPSLILIAVRSLM